MRTIQTEAAVFGTGLAGLTTAVTLLEQGIRTAVFEKRGFQGGAVSNTPMITMSVKNDRKFQDRAYKVHCEYTNYNCNLPLARKWINNTYRTPDFIRGLGLDFLDVVETKYEEIGTIYGYTGSFPKGMNLGDYYLLKARGRGHGGALICLRAARKVKQLGGEIYFHHPLKELVRDPESGVVTGAIVVNEGEEIRIQAKAVIVATGGCSEDPKMVEELSGMKCTDRNLSKGGEVTFNHFYNSGLTGDGLKAIWQAGGARTPVYCNGRFVPGPGIVGYVPWITRNQIPTLAEQPLLIVNRNGKRFVDESMGQSSFDIGVAIMNQPGRKAYLVFDDGIIDHLETVGTAYSYMIFPSQRLHNVREELREMVEVQHSEHVFLADSLSQLAEQMEVPAEELEKTVARYNQLCEEGYDEDLGKPSQYLKKLVGKRYYALRLGIVHYSTIGGVRIDENGNVVDEEQRPIQGLYAAGDLAASELFGYPSTGACSLSAIAFGQGFICADSAAQYIREA